METTEYTLDQLKGDPTIVVTNKAFNNGIMNSEDQAIRNGFMQLGAPGDFILAYDPTHGFFLDLFEVGLNKSGFTTANSMAALGLDTILHDNSPGVFINAGHSAGGESLYQQMLNADDGVFSNSIVLFYGTPQNTDDLENAAYNSGANFGGHSINPGDPVAILAGGNFTNIDEFMDGVVNLPDLFGQDSPHSDYYCTNSIACPL